MNIFITLDYELFFGDEPGSPHRCILEPANALHEIVKAYNYKLCFFVDAGYLIAMKKYNRYESYNAIIKQLKKFSEYGHDIQLHIHSHWEDTHLINNKWVFNYERYRLQNFHESDIKDIVYRYKKELNNIAENKINTFRAGGWSIQPFEGLRNALKTNGIYIDSTVFKGGYYKSDYQYFDFRKTPNKSSWNFKFDPCNESQTGDFLEMPIASQKVSPFFFWKLAIAKFKKDDKHKPFGDGASIRNSKGQLFKLLTKPSYSVVSIDGYKSSYLEKAFTNYSRLWPEGDFVIIGHPKAFTKYSLEQLDLFLRKYGSKNQSKVYSQIKSFTE